MITLTQPTYVPKRCQLAIFGQSAASFSVIEPSVDVYFGRKNPLDPDSPMSRERKGSLFIKAYLAVPGALGGLLAFIGHTINIPEVTVAGGITTAIMGLAIARMQYIDHLSKTEAKTTLFYQFKKSKSLINLQVSDFKRERQISSFALINKYMQAWKDYSPKEIAKSGNYFCIQRDRELNLLLAFCAMPCSEKAWRTMAEELDGLFSASPRLHGRIVDILTEALEEVLDSLETLEATLFEPLVSEEKHTLNEWKNDPHNQPFITYLKRAANTPPSNKTSIQNPEEYQKILHLLDMLDEPYPYWLQ